MNFKKTTDANTQSYTYNQASRLKTATANDQTTTYAYNALGLRSQKTNANQTTLYLYHLNGLLIAEADGQGKVQREYVYLDQQPLALMDYTNSSELMYYYHNDHLGTPQLLTNQTKDIRWQASYTPFGEAVISVETVTQNIRFPGQYYDVETGLHYNWYRYYDSRLGRYITSDPIGLAGGINTYGYAYQNPIRYTDPEGLAVPLVLPALPAIGKIVGSLIGVGLGVGVGAAMSSSSDLPKTDSCNAAEQLQCAAQCGGSYKVNGCYVTVKWKFRGVRGGNPIRSSERVVNCNCDDDDDNNCD